MSTPADFRQRQRALDPETSFIVQAPAGSGKTGLLTQRFIVLLAGVDAPEEIVAITFTRKAAAEMRQRILQALQRAEDETPPADDYERQTWALARQALAQDSLKGWQLLQNPSRLRIQTIDSLCASLVQQMPVLSRLGVMPAITEDAEALYLEAAAGALGELESGGEFSDAIAHLAAHLDNQLPRLQQLLASMLARRDQWLRHIARPEHPSLARQSLEMAFEHLVADSLHALAQAVPQEYRNEIVQLARFAAAQVDAGQNADIASLQDLTALPEGNVDNRQLWTGLAELLLTTDGRWRARVDKRQGFPAATAGANPAEKERFKTMKQRMQELLAALQAEERFRLQLSQVRHLPAHKYSDNEWATLQALIQALSVASAYLQIVFAESGQIDFAALAQAAITALGEEDNPTDLALALDYRIRHLLVDEFQDTAFNQYELLRRLTAGWQPGDGHSLFVVGDPMQSIYRFREAEVGLFIDACEHGLANVPLEFLRLSVNFRSQQGIVDWINDCFLKVMPAQDDAASGAVAYSPSIAFHPQLDGQAVHFHATLEKDFEAEAREVVNIVRQSKKEDPQTGIAIIVRGRAHLVDIILQLQQAGLRYQAVEIERLSHRPVIQDLLAITRALLQPADRIAWLAVLRAPFCGLTLADLHTLAAADRQSSIIDLLHQKELTGCLSEDGRQRLARVLPLLETALAQQLRQSLRLQVEGLWLALGGPACVASVTDLEDAEVYFQLLEKVASGGMRPDAGELKKQVEALFALPDVEADGSLQLITIHKAKGLEFDTVILPGLGRAPKSDESRLLHWLEYPHESGSELLLAPISAHGEDKNSMVASLQLLEKNKARYEDTRLLYVAATRARKRLHLFAHATVSESRGEQVVRPAGNSLLASLWPVAESCFTEQLAGFSPSQQDEAASALLTDRAARQRLAGNWSMPSLPEAVATGVSQKVRRAGELLEFDWAGETARHIGTVVHRLLQHVGEQGLENLDAQARERLLHRAGPMLLKSGISQSRLEAASLKARQALTAAFADTRGQWILSGQHREVGNEMAITAWRDGEAVHMVIDRTFVDEKGNRWIIDYKTGSHSGGGLEAFLDREVERYRTQLENYARAIGLTENRPIRLGLYFPLLAGWREWPYEP
ncbi:MAG TPA: DNA helicase UvrD [Gammaproteobacteria bacterium]|nr:DNA helicase UvrD [Gammaproteobacteria bacterium]